MGSNKTKKELQDEINRLNKRIRELENDAYAKEQEHFIQQLIDAIPSPIYFKNKKNTYIGCNKAFESYLGLPKKDIVGKTHHQTAPKKQADLYTKQDKSLLRNKKVQIYESRIVSADGTERNVEFRKSVFSKIDGKVSGIVGVAFDITERLKLEQEARENAATIAASESALKTIQAMDVGILLFKRNGTILSANPRFVKFSGKKAKTLEGKKVKTSVTALFSQADHKKVKAFLAETLQGNEAAPIVAAFNPVKNRETAVIMSAAFMDNKKTENSTVVLTVKDITKQLEMEEALREAERNQMLYSITSFVSSLEARDHYTRGHSEAVAEIISGIAKMLKVPDEEYFIASIGSKLHDIGKIGVPDNILLKQGRLTKKEFNQIKCHPLIGAKILKSIPSLSEVIGIVLSHHERIDGKGYPHGLKGSKIPFWARVTAVADTFHALTSDRPYRKQMKPETALQIIDDVKGTQLCPECIALFHKWLKISGKLK